MSAAVAGLNHNIRYQARIFHIQTENLGALQRDIYTQLFLGGNVVASVRSVCAPTDHGRPAGEVLRQAMEVQHKAVARALLAGAHDEVIARYSTVVAYEPGVLANGMRAPELLVGGTPVSLPAAKPRPAAVPVSEPTLARTVRTLPAAPLPNVATAPPPPSRNGGQPQNPASLADDIIVRHLVSEFDDPT